MNIFVCLAAVLQERKFHSQTFPFLVKFGFLEVFTFPPPCAPVIHPGSADAERALRLCCLFLSFPCVSADEARLQDPSEKDKLGVRHDIVQVRCGEARWVRHAVRPGTRHSVASLDMSDLRHALRPWAGHQTCVMHCVPNTSNMRHVLRSHTRKRELRQHYSPTKCDVNAKSTRVSAAILTDVCVIFSDVTKRAVCLVQRRSACRVRRAPVRLRGVFPVRRRVGGEATGRSVT